LSRGGSQAKVLAVLLAIGVVASGCAGPGTQPLADAVAEQCDQVRAMEALVSVGEAFVASVERGDKAQAADLVKQSEGLWFQAQSGIHAQPEGSAVPDAFWTRQDSLAAARPRFEMFKAVIAATPMKDAAAGTERILPEVRALLAAVDVSECAPVEHASG
jgi:hypothetical protein